MLIPGLLIAVITHVRSAVVVSPVVHILKVPNMALSDRPGLVHGPLEPHLLTSIAICLMAINSGCWLCWISVRFPSGHWSNCHELVAVLHATHACCWTESPASAQVRYDTRLHQEFSNFVITLPPTNTYIYSWMPPSPAICAGRRWCGSSHCNRSVSDCTVTAETKIPLSTYSRCSFTATKQIAKCFVNCSYIFLKHQPVHYILVTCQNWILNNSWELADPPQNWLQPQFEKTRDAGRHVVSVCVRLSHVGLRPCWSDNNHGVEAPLNRFVLLIPFWHRWN
jgi:hypothetical protein